MTDNFENNVIEEAQSLWGSGEHEEAIQYLLEFQTRQRNINVYRMLTWMYAYQGIWKHLENLQEGPQSLEIYL